MKQVDNTSVAFQRRLETLIRSGGEKIVFIKTNEWLRAVRLVSSLAETFTPNRLDKNPLDYAKGLVSWDLIKGVQDEKGTIIFPGKPPGAGTSSLSLCVDEFTNPESKTLVGYNFMTVLWPHALMKDNPAMLQVIENARHAMIMERVVGGKAHNINKRMFMIVPTEFQLPRELSSMPIVKLELPRLKEMEELVMDVLDGVLDNSSLRPDFSELEIRQIANSCLGVGETEAVNALTQALSDFMPDMPNVDAEELASYVMGFKVETIEKCPALRVMKTVPVNEVGGLEVIKADARRLRMAYSPRARQLKVDMPRGCLLVGSSGTGKSLTARAIAGMLGIPAIELNIGALMGGIVGQTESQTEQALDIIEAIGASVVMVDEIEKAIGGQDNNSGVSRRLLGNLLTRMNDSTSGTYWVFTSNDYSALPPELTRAGRLDVIYFVDMPNAVEREAIFRIHMNKRDITFTDDLAEAVRATQGFNSAEIEQVVKDAHIMAVEDSNGTTGDFGMDALLVAVSKTNPLSVTSSAKVERMREWGKMYARNASHVDESSTEVTTGVAAHLQRRARPAIRPVSR